jgi:hypothetical protein
MGLALQRSTEMREMQCGECGIEFYAPEKMMAEKQRSGGGWYCPNGHIRIYTETTETKLRKQLADRDARLADRDKSIAWERSQRETEAQRARLAEKKLKSITTRVSAGVCPECNRTFQQLARHMACKHKKD